MTAIAVSAPKAASLQSTQLRTFDAGSVATAATDPFADIYSLP